MHHYSTDESRVRVYTLLAIIALIAAWGVSAALRNLSWPSWLVGAPSFAGFFSLTFKLFDEFVWRTTFARRARLVSVADVRGRYEGNLISVFEDAGAKVTKDVAFDIEQTWTRLSVVMTVISGTSSSRSTSALGALSSDGATTKLVYVYANKVHPGIADADMGDHDGAAEVRIHNDGSLEGRYFNSRPRAGSISARRISSTKKRP